IVTQEASELLSVCIDERVERLQQFLEERDIRIPTLLLVNPPCPLKIESSSPYLDHIEWVKGLSDVDVQTGTSWLQSIVESRYAREIALASPECDDQGFLTDGSTLVVDANCRLTLVGSTQPLNCFTPAECANLSHTCRLGFRLKQMRSSPVRSSDRLDKL